MTEKTYLMFTPGKTPDGKGTYIEQKLEHATNREEAKVIAMGIVRALGVEQMFLVENPNELVFANWPIRPVG